MVPGRYKREPFALMAEQHAHLEALRRDAAIGWLVRVFYRLRMPTRKVDGDDMLRRFEAANVIYDVLEHGFDYQV